MRTLAITAVALALLAAPASADGERAGAFDYYLLSLSWSPNWCALEGEQRDAAQCARGARIGWVLHGLWPQNEDGSFPSYCLTDARDPSRRETAAMADIMGEGGAVWYQWKKHGRCSGLTAASYFGAARRAFSQVTLPPAFQRLRENVTLPPALVEQAFLQENPQLAAAGVTITCDGGRIQEVRICLDRRLRPRSCGEGARLDCRQRSALMDAPR